MTNIGEWLKLAADSKVVIRALKMASIVGCVLAVINHGDAIYHGQMTGDRVFKIVLTFCVPYLVSTISSVAAMREFARKAANETS